MKQRIPLLFCLALCWPSYGEAQQTVIAANRVTNWQNAGIPGGIPSRTTICSTLSPGATAAQINNAISGCPSGQVVFLNAGTYTLSTGLSLKSNVTLRGAGPHLTLLNFSNSGSCRGFSSDVCFAASSNPVLPAPSANATWTGGYAKGTTTVTLSNTSGLQVGSLLVLDQMDDASDPGAAPFVNDSSTYTEQGGGGFARANRAQQQLVYVTGLSGNNVTFTPGLHASNWRSGQSPGAYWANSLPIINSGIENLSVNHSASGAQSGITFLYAYQCWAKNIQGLYSDRNQVWFYQSARIVVRDSYFYGAQAGASQSYGIEWATASDILVENNIIQHFSGHLTINGASAGSVIAYNYAFDDNYNGWLIGDTSVHDSGSDYILSEGNDMIAVHSDNVHGTHNFNTFHRNKIAGAQPAYPGSSAKVRAAANLWTYSRFYNFVGNILGTSGSHVAYESNLSGSADVIFRLGQQPEGTTHPTDPVVRQTLLRWGNYDTFTQTVRFLPAEVPSGLSQFANPVPVNTILPASLYLSSKPSFFGSRPWPAAGPDVTGGDITGTAGHAFKIPARICYENTPKTNGILTAFNGLACYGGSAPTAPSAPINLRIIP